MHTYLPSSIIFQLGSLSIHWYGLLVTAGFLAGLFVLVRLFRFYGRPPAEAYDLFFYVIIFGLLGARIYYVFYDWAYYSGHLIDVFKVWQGGLAIHGAIIAALLTIYFYSRRRGWTVLVITDIVAACVPLALAIGRWGNYFNQELFGRPTNLPWGIPISLANRPAEYITSQYFHPTFLYESLMDLALAAVLLCWHCRCLKQAAKSQLEVRPGEITLGFLFGYSLIRFVTEFWRVDYSPLVFGLRWAQVLSGVVMVGVIGFWLKIKTQNSKLESQNHSSKLKT
ncbi:MAG: prolipoprotein diacylglyceryl transferase [Patescibacteria group bacterium]|jgi:phosphatidylglycerol:prolipoprotein diacylglycerol transferase